LVSGTCYGYLLENIAGGTGFGYVSIDVGQGASSTDLQIGTDHWVSAGDMDRSIDSIFLEDAVLLFTTGSTTDATWLSDTSAWTLSSESSSGVSQYITTITRTVGSSTVTVKATTTLNPYPNRIINEKYEISVSGDPITNVKLFAYTDFAIDLGVGDRSYPVGFTENPRGDAEDYSYVLGTLGAGGGDDFTLVAYDSFVSSGSVPAPPPGQADVSIGIREKGPVSPSRWEINEYSTLSDKLNDLVNGITTDLNLLNTDATGGALKDTEFAFQYNLGTITSSGGPSTLEFEKIISPVPEPATLLLIGMGLCGLAIFGRKK